MSATKTEETLDVEALRYRIRHSAAHIMADAVQQLFPEAKLGIGPPIEDGFYYDFEVAHPFAPEDLEAIEARMREIMGADKPFQRMVADREAAGARIGSQPFKQEVLEDIPPNEEVSFYRHGDWEDLCEGPHVESTGRIPAFKLLNVAGAYWRGDERRPMLQRIYGTAWESAAALEDYVHRREEALRRDHRRLGRELDLFSVHDETGAGLILWHPKGGRVRSLIEDHWRQEHYRRGYDLVYTPHIGKSALWETSGHLSFFSENMYAPMDVAGQDYYLKPMNCPFHIMIYKSGLRSYRDLPMRIGELGTVYRNERGGVLHGLLRVRGFTQDDAHIFCRPDQVNAEVNGVLAFTFDLLGAFGFTEFDVALSTRPEKAVGDDSMWDAATNALRQAIEGRSLPYTVDEGGGAFYGPKIDVMIRDAIGRAWQCTTVQFDFNLPQRFDLKFIGADGAEQQPYMVHRALFGSLERFIGVLVEHYGGAFPLWLAPVQAIVIPIADRHNEYASSVAAQLRAAGLRVEINERSERMNAKIRDAQLQKIPYMLVVGDKEASNGQASVRLRSGEDLGPMSVSAISDLALQTVANRA